MRVEQLQHAVTRSLAHQSYTDTGRYFSGIESTRASNPGRTRSRWSGIATGDQAVFVRRSTFEAIQGFPDKALMEDIALSRTLKRLGPPACLRDKVTTSARRWERNGIASTVVLMWTIRLAYWLGTNPSKLAALYGNHFRDNKSL